MPLKISVTDTQTAKDQIRKELEKLMTDKFVTVGMHEDAGAHEDSELTNAQLGAILHFGADIDHPGGTNYGYATEQDAAEGRVRFLAKGQGYASLGTTKPHKIKIPPRPFLDVGVATGNQDYLALIAGGLEDGLKPDQILNQIGNVAAGKVQQYMTELKTPPNADSTVARKGSANPLVDTGALRQSVTYKIQSGKPEEGIG